MTADDALSFAQAFNRLAVATRLPAEQMDEAVQQIYWDGLEDLPLEAVIAAAGEMERRAQWFPKVSEWREAAKPHAIVARLKALPPPARGTVARRVRRVR